MGDKLYTVGEVADLTGVSVKTLHYYQTQGLLTPEKIGENKYRYYSHQQLDVLHQILAYRLMDISIKEIKSILEATADKQRIEILEAQLEQAREKSLQLQQVIDNLQRTLEKERSYMKNEKETKQIDNEQFEGLTKDENIYQTMRNVGFLMSYPINFMLWIFSVFLTYTSISTLFTGKYVYADGKEGLFAAIAFSILGIVVFILTTRLLFFTKFKDQMTKINSGNTKIDKKNK